MQKSSYRPKYHASVPAGWSNDPNGTIWYGGKAHLFYQHYPYKAQWGTMHWGHMVSEDLIHWDYLGTAFEDYQTQCAAEIAAAGLDPSKHQGLWAPEAVRIGFSGSLRKLLPPSSETARHCRWRVGWAAV